MLSDYINRPYFYIGVYHCGLFGSRLFRFKPCPHILPIWPSFSWNDRFLFPNHDCRSIYGFTIEYHPVLDFLFEDASVHYILLLCPLRFKSSATSSWHLICLRSRIFSGSIRYLFHRVIQVIFLSFHDSSVFMSPKIFLAIHRSSFSNFRFEILFTKPRFSDAYRAWSYNGLVV